jgi:hypothetical protein
MTVAGCCLALSVAEEIEAAHLRHAHVGEDDVRAERVDQRERGLPAVGDLDLVAVLASRKAQQRPKDEADVLFVVDYQTRRMARCS